MRQLFSRHPLLIVLLVAVALKLPAVIWSKGYMASDDHFETVQIAHRWLTEGAWHDDGIRMWEHRPANEHARFPLYNGLLYGVMRAHTAVGITDLDTMMYTMRALHALLSLLAVWAAFGILKVVTRSVAWASAAGVVMAAFFPMSFLSVRNLIEMVGGNLWLVALLFLYRYRYSRSVRALWLSGVMIGLAWMVRFEICFAVLPIPIVLWWQERDIKPALHFVGSIVTMLIIASISEIFLLNGFAASTIAHIRQVLTEPPPYQSLRLTYVLILVGGFIPPFSLILLYLSGARRLIREHAALWFSIVAFLLAHTISGSRQERYILPVLPAILVLFVLAVKVHLDGGGFFARHRKAGKRMLVTLAVINLLLLAPFSLNYAHKGLVEPLVQMGRVSEHPRILFVDPDDPRLYPFAYGGLQWVIRGYVHDWADLGVVAGQAAGLDRYEFFLLYPPDAEHLPAYLDSLQVYTGPLSEFRHVGPSVIDAVVYWLNPRHNSTNEAWVYTRPRNQTHNRSTIADSPL